MDKIYNLKFGYYLSVLLSFLTAVTFAIAILTPPLSGPWCRAETCFVYPFTGIEDRFPRDYLWMYAAIVQLGVFILFMTYLNSNAVESKKVYGQAGLIFSAISVAILIIDYFLQLSVVQPSLLKGEFDGIALLTQYNPHGVFIALEEIGYLLMSFSFILIAPIFAWSGLQKYIKGTLVTGFILNIISLIGFAMIYGHDREYRFEIATISINWLVLIILGVLTAIFFKNKSQEKTVN